MTPISPAMAPVLTLAHSVSSHPAGAFLRRADLGRLGRRSASFLLVARYLIVLLPRLRAGMARGHHRRRCSPRCSPRTSR